MKDSIEADSFYAASNAARVEADAKIADRFFPTTAKEPDEESKANETMRESEFVEDRNARHADTLFSANRVSLTMARHYRTR